MTTLNVIDLRPTGWMSPLEQVFAEACRSYKIGPLTTVTPPGTPTSELHRADLLITDATLLAAGHFSDWLTRRLGQVPASHHSRIPSLILREIDTATPVG